MTNSFCIRSKLLDNNSVALLANVSASAAETPVVVTSIGGSATPSLGEQWIGESDPSGFFFIKSAANPSLVLNIKGASETSTNPTGKSAFLDINTIENGWHLKQLWKFSLNSPEEPYLFIESALTAPNGQPFVLNIKGTSSGKAPPTTGTQLDVSPKAGFDRELWIIEVPAGLSGVVPGESYPSKVTLPPVSAQDFLQINGTGFAPGWLSVGNVSMSATSTGVVTAGPQSNAGTVVNFDGTFQTTVQLLPPAFEVSEANLHVFVQDSLGIPYGINAVVLNTGAVQTGAQGRNI